MLLMPARVIQDHQHNTHWLQLSSHHLGECHASRTASATSIHWATLAGHKERWVSESNERNQTTQITDYVEPNALAVAWSTE